MTLTKGVLEEYYDAIAKCNIDGSYTRFIEFMLEQIDNLLDEVSLSNADNQMLSEYVKKLLHAMDYDTPYTRNNLMELIGIKSISSFRENYLMPALKMRLI